MKQKTTSSGQDLRHAKIEALTLLENQAKQFSKVTTNGIGIPYNTILLDWQFLKYV
jgi:hypothetical protein